MNNSKKTQLKTMNKGAMQIERMESNPTPLMEEYLMMIDNASELMDKEADGQTPDPVGDGTDLLREAAEMRLMIERCHADLLKQRGDLLATLKELELFVRVLGLDSEPARLAAESARAAIAKSEAK